jgi:hypothetical protein
MLAVALIELLIALFLLIFSSKIQESKTRRLIEFGIFMQFLLSISLVVIYLLY